MKAYYAIVRKDPDSAFGVEFPDLPGVFSAADTENAIVSNAIEALRLWAEDEALPVPASLEAVRANADVQDALAEGGFLVRVPLIETEGRSKTANVTFDAGTLRAIDAAAKTRGLTRSAFLADVARKEIEATG